MKIFLIGLSGVGKSTFGKELSELTNSLFIDLDSEIEKSEKNTIDLIFKNKGENHFRKLESHHLKSLSVEPDFVMATGGGTPCFYDNLDWMLQNGIVLYLVLPISDIVSQLNNSYQRPLLGGANKVELRNKLENQLKEREGDYSKAHIKIDLKELDREKLLEKLAQF